MVRYRRNPGVESAPLQDETILFDQQSKKFCLLNRTAALIWDRLQEGRTPEHLSADVRAQYPDVEPSRVEQDVRAALQQLADLAFVVAEP